MQNKRLFPKKYDMLSARCWIKKRKKRGPNSRGLHTAEQLIQKLKINKKEEQKTFYMLDIRGTL